MKFMNEDRIYGRVFREEAGEGGEAGGAGGGDTGEGETDYKAMVEQLTQERESLSNKVNELLGESKRAKEARRAAERQAQEEARAKAEAEGNYQELFKSSEQKRQELAEQLEQMQGTIAKKETNQAAYKVASSLAEGENVELLAEFVRRRLKYTEDGVKVTDNDGNLTVSSLDDLKKEFEGSARYASLIKGKQSSGGGASGGSGDGGAAKEITRAEFSALDPASRMKFVKAGGKIVDQ